LRGREKNKSLFLHHYKFIWWSKPDHEKREREQDPPFAHPKNTPKSAFRIARTKPERNDRKQGKMLHVDLRGALRRRAISFVQNLDHVRHSLPMAEFLDARAKLEHAARIGRGDALCSRGVDALHFLRE